MRLITSIATLTVCAAIAIGCPSEEEPTNPPVIESINPLCGPGEETGDPNRLVNLTVIVSDEDGDVTRVEANLGGTVLDLTLTSENTYVWDIGGYTGDSIICNQYLYATIDAKDATGNTDSYSFRVSP